jgi:RNA polymerase sigma factor (sigma-70 family)
MRNKTFKRLEKAILHYNRLLEGDNSLWGHQNSAMDAVGSFLWQSMEKIREGETASGALVMPTGSGKTALTVEIARRLGLRAMALAPTVKIARQHEEELAQRAPEIKTSMYYSDEKDLSGQVIVITYQSAVSLLKSGQLPDDIDISFYDEAHRSISPQRSRLHKRLGLLEIGLTATPEFNEDRHIWDTYDETIYQMDLQEAAELGIISPLRGFMVETNVDLRDTRLKIGQDYLNEAEAEKYLNVIARNKAARDFYLDSFQGVPAVAFCISQAHAEDFARYMNQSNIKATFVHAGLTNKEREKRLKSFEDGSVDIITNRDVLIEGWDSKRAVLELCLRPTYSRVVKTHMIGRVARAREGKEAGLVVEFQDVYRQGDQPVLMYHLLDQLEYRQGGLALASKESRLDEERKVRTGTRVHVIGNLDVSFQTRKVVAIEQRKADLTDKDLLREILQTHDVDYTGLSFAEFAKMKFAHPDFHGSGSNLIHRALGIRTRNRGGLNTTRDYRDFLWYVLEHEMEEADRRARFPEDVLGLSFADGFLAKASRETGTALIDSRLLQSALACLTPREERFVIKRYFQGKTLDKIGEELGMTKAKVHTIELRVFRKMRSPDFFYGKLKEHFAPVPEPVSIETIRKMGSMVRLKVLSVRLRRQAIHFLMRVGGRSGWLIVWLYGIAVDGRIPTQIKSEVLDYLIENSNGLIRLKLLLDTRIPKEVRDRIESMGGYFEFEQYYQIARDTSMPQESREQAEDLMLSMIKDYHCGGARWICHTLLKRAAKDEKISPSTRNTITNELFKFY